LKIAKNAQKRLETPIPCKRFCNFFVMVKILIPPFIYLRFSVSKVKNPVSEKGGISGKKSAEFTKILQKREEIRITKRVAGRLSGAKRRFSEVFVISKKSFRCCVSCFFLSSYHRLIVKRVCGRDRLFFLPIKNFYLSRRRGNGFLSFLCPFFVLSLSAGKGNL